MKSELKLEKRRELDQKVQTLKSAFEKLIEKFESIKKLDDSNFHSKINKELCGNIENLKENIFLSLSKIKKKKEVDYILEKLTEKANAEQKDFFFESFQEFNKNNFSHEEEDEKEENNSYPEFISSYNELTDKKTELLNYLENSNFFENDDKYESLEKEIYSLNKKLSNLNDKLSTEFLSLDQNQKNKIHQSLMFDKKLNSEIQSAFQKARGRQQYELKNKSVDKEELNFYNSALSQFNSLYISLKNRLNEILKDKERFLQFLKPFFESHPDHFTAEEVFIQIDLKVDQVKWDFNFKLYELKEKYSLHTITDERNSVGFINEMRMKITEIEKVILVLLNEHMNLIKNDLKQHFSSLYKKLTNHNTTNSFLNDFKDDQVVSFDDFKIKESVVKKNNFIFGNEVPTLDDENFVLNEEKLLNESINVNDSISKYESLLGEKLNDFQRKIDNHIQKADQENNSLISKLENKIDILLKQGTTANFDNSDAINSSFETFGKKLLDQVSTLKAKLDDQQVKYYEDTKELANEIKSLKQKTTLISEQNSKLIIDTFEKKITSLEDQSKEPYQKNLTLLTSIMDKNDEDQKYIKSLLKEINERNKGLNSEIEHSKILLHNAKLTEIEELIESQNREFLNLQNDKNDLLFQIESNLKNRNQQERVIEKISSVQSEIASIQKTFETKINSLESSFIDKFTSINNEYFDNLKAEQSELSSALADDAVNKIKIIESKLLTNFEEIKESINNDVVRIHNQINEVMNEENEKLMNNKISDLIQTVEEIRKVEEGNILNKMSLEDLSSLVEFNARKAIMPALEKIDHYKDSLESIYRSTAQEILQEVNINSNKNKKEIMDDVSKAIDEKNLIAKKLLSKFNLISIQINNKLEKLNEEISGNMDVNIKNFKDQQTDFFQKNRDWFFSIMKSNQDDKKYIKSLIKELNQQNENLSFELENSKVELYNNRLQELDQLILRQNDDLLSLMNEKDSVYKEIENVLKSKKQAEESDKKLTRIENEILNISTNFEKKVTDVEEKMLSSINELNNSYIETLDSHDTKTQKNILENQNEIENGIKLIEQKLVDNFELIKENTYNNINNILEEIKNIKNEEDYSVLEAKFQDLAISIEEIKTLEEKNLFNRLTSDDVSKMLEHNNVRVVDETISRIEKSYKNESANLYNEIIKNSDKHKTELLEKISTLIDFNIERSSSIFDRLLLAISNFEKTQTSIFDRLEQNQKMHFEKSKLLIFNFIKNAENEQKHIKILLKKINSQNDEIANEIELTKVMFHNSKLIELDQLIQKQDEDLVTFLEEKENFYAEIEKVLLENKDNATTIKLDEIQNIIESKYETLDSKIAAIETTFVDEFRQANSAYISELQNNKFEISAASSEYILNGVENIENNITENFNLLKSNLFVSVQDIYDQINSIKSKQLNQEELKIELDKIIEHLSNIRSFENSNFLLNLSSEEFKSTIREETEKSVESKIGQSISHQDRIRDEILLDSQRQKDEVLQKTSQLIEHGLEKSSVVFNKLVDTINEIDSNHSQTFDRLEENQQLHFEKTKEFIFSFITNAENEQKYIKSLLKSINSKNDEIANEVELTKVMFHNSKLIQLDQLIQKQDEDLVTFLKEKENFYAEVEKVLLEKKEDTTTIKLDEIQNIIESKYETLDSKIAAIETTFVDEFRQANSAYISELQNNKFEISAASSEYILNGVENIENNITENFNLLKSNLFISVQDIYDQIDSIKSKQLNQEELKVELDKIIEHLSNIRSFEHSNFLLNLSSEEFKSTIREETERSVESKIGQSISHQDRIRDEILLDSQRQKDEVLQKTSQLIEHGLEKSSVVFNKLVDTINEIESNHSQTFGRLEENQQLHFEKTKEFIFNFITNAENEQKYIKSLLKSINSKNDEIANEIEVTKVMFHNSKLIELDNMIQKQDEELLNFLNEKENFYAEVEKVLLEKKEDATTIKLDEIQNIIESKYETLDSKIAAIETTFVDEFRQANSAYISELQNNKFEISAASSEYILNGVENIENNITENFNLLKSNLFISVQDIYDQIDSIKSKQLNQEELKVELDKIIEHLSNIRSFEHSNFLLNLSSEEFKSTIREETERSVESKIGQSISHQDRIRDEILLDSQRQKDEVLQKIAQLIEHSLEKSSVVFNKLVDTINEIESNHSQTFGRLEENQQLHFEKTKEFIFNFITNAENEQKYIKSLLKSINSKNDEIANEIEVTKVMFHNSKLIELDNMIQKQDEELLNFLNEKANFYAEVEKTILEKKENATVEQLKEIQEVIQAKHIDLDLKIAEFKEDFKTNFNSLNDNYIAELKNKKFEISEESTKTILNGLDNVENKINSNFDLLKENLSSSVEDISLLIKVLQEKELPVEELKMELEKVANQLNNIRNFEHSNFLLNLSAEEFKSTIREETERSVDSKIGQSISTQERIRDEILLESQRHKDEIVEKISKLIENSLEKASLVFGQLTNTIKEIETNQDNVFKRLEENQISHFAKTKEFIFNFINNAENEQKYIKELLKEINSKNDEIASEIEVTKVMFHNSKLIELDNMIQKQDEDLLNFLNEKANFYAEVEKTILEKKENATAEQLKEIREVIQSKHDELDFKISQFNDVFKNNFDELNESYINELKSKKFEISEDSTKTILNGLEDVESKISFNFNLLRDNLSSSVEDIYAQIRELQDKELPNEELKIALEKIAIDLNGIRLFESENFLLNLTPQEFKDSIYDGTAIAVERKMDRIADLQEKIRDEIISSQSISNEKLIEKFDDLKTTAKENVDQIFNTIKTSQELQRETILKEMSILFEDASVKNQFQLDEAMRQLNGEISRFSAQQVVFLKNIKNTFDQIITENKKDRDFVVQLLEKINDQNNELTSELENSKLMFHNSKLLEVEELLSWQNQEFLNLVHDKNGLYNVIERILSSRKEQETQDEKILRVENEIKNLSTGLESKISSMENSFIEKFSDINATYFEKLKDNADVNASLIAEEIYGSIQKVENRMMSNFENIRDDLSLSIINIADQISELRNNSYKPEELAQRFDELAEEIMGIKEFESNNFLNTINKSEFENIIQLSSLRAADQMTDQANKHLFRELKDLIVNNDFSKKEEIVESLSTIINKNQRENLSEIEELKVLSSVGQQGIRDDLRENFNEVKLYAEKFSSKFFDELKNFEQKTENLIIENHNWVKRILLGNNKNLVFLQSLINRLDEKFELFKNEFEDSKLNFYKAKIEQLESLLLSQSNDLMSLVDERKEMFNSIDKILEEKQQQIALSPDTISVIENEVKRLVEDLNVKIDLRHTNFEKQINTIEDNISTDDVLIRNIVHSNIQHVKKDLQVNYQTMKSNLLSSVNELLILLANLRNDFTNENNVVEKFKTLSSQIKELFEKEQNTYLSSLSATEINNLLETKIYDFVEKYLLNKNLKNSISIEDLDLTLDKIIDVFKIKTVDDIEKTSNLLDKYNSAKLEAHQKGIVVFELIKSKNLEIKNYITILRKQLNSNFANLLEESELDSFALVNDKMHTLINLIDLNLIELDNLNKEHYFTHESVHSIILNFRKSEEHERNFHNFLELSAESLKTLDLRMESNFESLKETIKKISFSQKEKETFDLDDLDKSLNIIVNNNGDFTKFILDDLIKTQDLIIILYHFLRDNFAGVNNQIDKVNQNQEITEVKKIESNQDNDLQLFDSNFYEYLNIVEKKKREIKIFYKKLRDLKNRRGFYNE